MIALMKEQNKELKLNKKKLEKLEEKFIKANKDLNNIINDKANVEAFLKNIFPKEMHDQVIKEEYGKYDTSELSKLWLILESKNQGEYQNILSGLKSEISELTDKNKSLSEELQTITSEFEKYKSDQQNSSEQLTFYMNGYEDYKKQVENLENERSFLMKVLDEKNEEINTLNSLELENAELKAQSLLNNFDMPPTIKSSFDGISQKTESLKETENQAKIQISSLNMGVQTETKMYTQEDFDKIQNELESYKKKYDKLKQSFSEYKEKSNSIFLTNEANYNKILTEHENLKKELSNLLQKHSENQGDKNNQNARQQIQAPSIHIDEKLINGSQKVNLEYLKNVLLKYLEAIAIGNEFQTKILENVIFTFLNVSNKEKKYLEERRITSSFYYNLWYNAKSFLSSKLYGEENEERKDGEN